MKVIFIFSCCLGFSFAWRSKLTPQYLISLLISISSKLWKIPWFYRVPQWKSYGSTEFRNKNLRQINQWVLELWSVIQTPWQKKRDYYIIYTQAWEPSFAWKLSFSTKVNLLNLKLFNQAKNILLVLPTSSDQIWGRSVKGFLCYYLTYKQTHRDYYFIYINKMGREQ